MRYRRTTQDDDDAMIEDPSDCCGKNRRFRLGPYADGRFFEGVELRGGEATGWRFVLPVDADADLPWGEMRKLIRANLAQRDMVRREDGQLEVLNERIRAQLHDCGADGTVSDVPVVLVDDLELSWEALGRVLMTYAGWNLDIRILDPSEASRQPGR